MELNPFPLVTWPYVSPFPVLDPLDGQTRRRVVAEFLSSLFRPLPLLWPEFVAEMLSSLETFIGVPREGGELLPKRRSWIFWLARFRFSPRSLPFPTLRCLLFPPDGFVPFFLGTTFLWHDLFSSLSQAHKQSPEEAWRRRSLADVIFSGLVRGRFSSAFKLSFPAWSVFRPAETHSLSFPHNKFCRN